VFPTIVVLVVVDTLVLDVLLLDMLVSRIIDDESTAAGVGAGVAIGSGAGVGCAAGVISPVDDSLRTDVPPIEPDDELLDPSFRTRVGATVPLLDPVYVRRVESCVVPMLPLVPGVVVERTVVSVVVGVVLPGVAWAAAAPALMVSAMALPMARVVMKRRVIPKFLRFAADLPSPGRAIVAG
jgi:hypothetical protein